MSEERYSWVEDLVDEDSKAFGVYLALFYLRVKEGSTNFPEAFEGSRMAGAPTLQEWYAKYLAGRGPEAVEATKSGRTFMDKLFKHEKDALKAERRNQILEEIGHKFFDKFVLAFKRYIKFDRIPEELKEVAQKVLFDIRAQIYTTTTFGGLEASVSVFELKQKIPAYYGLREADKLLDCLESSGISIKYFDLRRYCYLFPAPCLSDEIINLLKPPVAEIKSLIPPPPQPERFATKPSGEILENIVADVLRDLGFNVYTRTRRELKVGGSMEVDVWAEKRVADIKFSVYVSCKNWDRAIGRPVIDEEHGRVDNLRDWPQLKVIIAKEFAGDARKIAAADGFIAIELKEKADAGNAEDIYKLIYGTFNELFATIAPPRLLDIASKASKIGEELKKFGEELASLTSKPGGLREWV